eukprot:24270_1
MSKSKALELKQRLQKLPKSWPENENRILIREGLLFIEEDRILKPRWCFLFNDLFLECKPACEFADNFSRLADPATPYRFKNYIMLNTCYIEENPNTIKKRSKVQHRSTPFFLVGHNIESQQKNKRIELEFIYSALSLNERELWCSDLHSSICAIHTAVNTDQMNYGWQNQYRKGTIFHAVYTLHNTLVKQLSAKLAINEALKDIGGHNLLHLAMAVNNVDFVDTHGASINTDALDCNGWSALRIGCDNDSIEAVAQLTEELYPNLDEYYPSDRSINPSKVEPQQGAPPDDRTILHELCVRGQSELVEILLETGTINMEALDKEGNTPLHVASKKNQEQCVLLLLQHGAPPNLADFKGNRPLHHASKDMVARWLVAYGARLDLATHAKKACRDIWKDELNEYVPLMSTLQPTDCRIQSNVAETNVWFDDKLSNSCLLCGSGFTVFSRRHHCRVCGLLVCQACSSRKLQFSDKDFKQCLQRACDKCFNKNHSKLLRKKEYMWCEKKYHMKAKEFYKMCVMETTLKGSYKIHVKSLEEMTVVEDQEEKKEIEKEEVVKPVKPIEKKEKPKPKPKANNGRNKENKGRNKESKGHHKFSRSLGFLNKTKTKNKDKNIKFAKHEAAQSEATFQAHDQAHKAINKAHERGEKLSELQDKSDQMANSAQNFNDLAKQLANKKW